MTKGQLASELTFCTLVGMTGLLPIVVCFALEPVAALVKKNGHSAKQSGR
jgi:hypothetical protein